MEIIRISSPVMAKGRKPEPTPGRKLIAEAFKAAVDASGLSIQLIAQRAGVSRQYVYKVRAGDANVSIAIIEAVFDAVQVPLHVWIEDRSFYGRDKLYHDKIQLILNRKDAQSLALKTTVDALLALVSQATETP